MYVWTELMARVFESKAVRSVKVSPSIRTTVPEPVAAILGLEVGDTIAWSVSPGSGEVSISRGAGSKSRKRA